MALANRASWIVAASISTVETLKDQGGLCRWKYTMRSLHQKAKTEMGSLSQARRTPSSSSSMIAGSELVHTRAEEAKRAEESFRKVNVLELLGSELVLEEAIMSNCRKSNDLQFTERRISSFLLDLGVHIM